MYIPASREGLSLKEMSEKQMQAAYELLKKSLSPQGHSKVLNIIELEGILGEIEGSSFRDPELYYVSIFGEPIAKGTWGWRFEGHHLSLNFSIVKGEYVATAPNFWGANPAKIPYGAKKGFRTLADEENLARALLHSLNKTQLDKAIINKNAYREIFTRDKSTVTPLKASGISYSELTGAQRGKLLELINVYLSNMTSEVTSERLARIHQSDLSKIRFSWAGGKDLGDRHYYRVQGESFLIEYDNYQNSGNHIHAVWRDFNGDFGRDLLQEHYKNSH